jgi:hypothetical protein
MSFDEAFSGAKKLKDDRRGNPKRDRRRNPKNTKKVSNKQVDKSIKQDE